VFVVLARKNWGEKCIPLTQVNGMEGRAITIAHEIYKNGGMNRALVVNEEFKIVFKIDRRCRCTNQQYQLDGRLQCQECKRYIPTNGEFKIEEYQ
jgi:hypothetical protein